jgi:diguanylate cyclase (GGDEF)-like protein
MHIRRKLLSGLALLFVLVAGTIVLTIYWMVLPGIAEAERQELTTEISRVQYAVKGEIDRLHSFAVDWGQWDDTYAYVRNKNPAYERSNLLDTTLGDVEANLIALVDQDGELVKVLPDDLTKTRLGRQQLRALLASVQSRGLLLVDEKTLLIASSDILPSVGEGIARGRIYFGKWLDLAMEERLSKELVLPLQFTRADHSASAANVEFLSREHSVIRGSMPFLNSTGQSLRVSLQHGRPYYQQALELIKLSLTMVVVVGMLVVSGAYFVIRWTLVEPILTLKHQTELFKRTRSSQEILELHQGDELGELSRSFVEMLKELETSNNVLEQERQKFLDESLTDPLTRLGNRRFLQRFFSSQKAAGQSGWIFLMLDLDYFKQVNDQYGHDVGDQVLVEIASLLTNINRHNDIVARFGGEEFVLVCRASGQNSEEVASALAERIRQAVEGHVFHARLGESFQVTCSVGFFALNVSGANIAREWPSMLKVSDLAMYAAKSSGRNTWVGVVPVGAECHLGYPVTADQIEQCVDREHLVVLARRKAPIRWERPVE